MNRFVAITFVSIHLLAAGTVDANPNDQLEDIEDKLNAKPELRFVKLVNHVIPGHTGRFQMRLLCDEGFTVKSLIVTARSTYPTEIELIDVEMLSDPFDGELAPPFGWDVKHTDFAIKTDTESAGYELLSNMDIIQLGLVGTSFDIIGTKAAHAVITMTIGATVETSGHPQNSCGIFVLVN